MRTSSRNLGYKLDHALHHPDRVNPFIRRWLRNLRLKRDSGDFSQFYRKVLAETARAEGADRAIGSFTEEHWMEVGQLQLDYLLEHGLKASDTVLDIGCGNLRAGWRLISYLDEGHYIGVDLSPEILIDATRKIGQFNIREKRPYLYLIDGTDGSFLPSEYFDVVHAHSVFSHTPIEVFEAYVRTVARVMKPKGYFDFTYIEDQVSSSFLSEDFRYPTEQLLDAACRNGLEGEKMTDWDYSQSKIRLRHPAKQSGRPLT